MITKLTGQWRGETILLDQNICCQICRSVLVPHGTLSEHKETHVPLPVLYSFEMIHHLRALKVWFLLRLFHVPPPLDMSHKHVIEQQTKTLSQNTWAAALTAGKTMYYTVASGRWGGLAIRLPLFSQRRTVIHPPFSSLSKVPSDNKTAKLRKTFHFYPTTTPSETSAHARALE